MQKPVFKLEVFDGPLDLLLFLISKNKVSIYDIPISLILEQYLEYIDDLKKMDLEVSSEFIEMAANLMYIKSKMLLPTVEEEEEDPREKLVRSLAEYKRYKSVVEPMRELNKKAGITYTRMMQVIEFDKKHTRVYSPDKLADAYRSARSRYEYNTTSPIGNFKGIVGKQITSVKSKIITVLRALTRARKVSFMSLFKLSKSRSDIIATFLAVLELSKNERISISGTDNEIYLDLKEKNDGV